MGKLRYTKSVILQLYREIPVLEANCLAGLIVQLSKTFWIIRKRRWLLWSAAVLSFGPALALTGAMTFFYYSAWGLADDAGNPIDWNRLARGDFKKASYILADDGSILDSYFIELRDPVKYEEIPQPIIDAFVAAEDKRFWNHPGIDGIDVIAASRAFLFDVARFMGAGSYAQAGASTIQMQFAKVFYANDVAAFRNRGPHETIRQKAWRKVLEVRFAIQLSRRYDRKKLMEGFLNSVYFGHGANGVSAAVRLYFSKDIRTMHKGQYASVVLARQAAMLTALNKSASAFDPMYHVPPAPQQLENETEAAWQQRQDAYVRARSKEQQRIIRTRIRCNWVLERMRDDARLNTAAFDAAVFSLSEPWTHQEIVFTPIKDRDYGYGSRFVKELLLTRDFTDEALTQTEGYRIRTSIVPYIQKMVSVKLRNHLAVLNSELPSGGERLNGAVVVLDLKTSRILALTGGDDYTKTPFNRTMSIRSAGSASKLIVYSSYFEEVGASYNSLLPNTPFSMVAKVDSKGRVLKRWSPKNFQEKNAVPYGMQPISLVLPRSVNLPAIHAAKRVGMPAIVKKAHRYGLWGTPGVVRDPDGTVALRVLGADKKLKDGIDPYLPTAIAMNVNLIELANAFTVTGRRGIYLPPSIIQEVRSAEGHVVYTAPSPAPLQVDDPEICRKMTVLLRAVTKYGTLKISMRDFRQEVGGKTGTSHEANDFNIVMLTPDLVLAIRIGYDYPRSVELPRYMKRASGDGSLHISAGWVVGPLARDILEAIYTTLPVVQFPQDTEEDLAALIAKHSK